MLDGTTFGGGSFRGLFPPVLFSSKVFIGALDGWCAGNMTRSVVVVLIEQAGYGSRESNVFVAVPLEIY